jgi:hypothetical protein
MKENIILVDCDGVLCDWEYAFTQFMHHKGFLTFDSTAYTVGERFNFTREQGRTFVEEFNNSAAIGFLPPLRDSVYYVKRLNMLHGYKFHCITSLSTNRYAQKLRIQNLELLFGKEVWEDFIFLKCGADKDEALAEYKDTGCFWIEDKTENARVGDRLGLNSILVAHTHNKDESWDIPRYWSWKEIYKHIIGEI